MGQKRFTGLVIFSSLLLVSLVSQNAFAMTFDVDNGGSLPDLVDITFTIAASGEDCDIEDIDVRLAIQHTWVGDLDITLESPSTTLVTLVDQPGNPPSNAGSGRDNFPDVILDDSASKPIETVDNPVFPQAYFEGDSYTPNGALSDFNGEDPNGVWKLRVVDNQNFDDGNLYKAGDTAPWGTAIGTQLIVTPEADCDMTVMVGGTFIPIDTTALLLAGIQTNAVWIMSALAVIGSIAFGAIYITTKKN